MDISYLLLLQNFRDATNGVLNSFMSYITTYGDELLTMIIAAAIYWCVDKDQGVFTFMTWGAGRLVNSFIKVMACVYRPWIRDARVVPLDGATKTATGYSFPSGHTTNATAVFGTIAANKKVSKLLRVVMIAMVILVGFSRNYIGVHTPQDVLVGCLSTVVLIFLIQWILRLVDKHPNLDIVILTVLIVLNIAVIFYAMLKNYPMDYDSDGNLIVNPAKMAIDTYKGCGFSLAVVISWFIDRRWLKYEIAGTPMERAGYFAAGILGYFVVLYVIVPLMPSNVVGSVLDRFIRLIYVMLVVPCLIKLSRRGKKQDIPEKQ